MVFVTTTHTVFNSAKVLFWYTAAERNFNFVPFPVLYVFYFINLSHREHGK